MESVPRVLPARRYAAEASTDARNMIVSRFGLEKKHCDLSDRRHTPACFARPYLLSRLRAAPSSVTARYASPRTTRCRSRISGFSSATVVAPARSMALARFVSAPQPSGRFQA